MKPVLLHVSAIFLSLVGGILVSLAFPPWNQDWLIWIGFTPVLAGLLLFSAWLDCFTYSGRDFRRYIRRPCFFVAIGRRAYERLDVELPEPHVAWGNLGHFCWPFRPTAR